MLIKNRTWRMRESVGGMVGIFMCHFTSGALFYGRSGDGRGQRPPRTACEPHSRTNSLRKMNAYLADAFQWSETEEGLENGGGRSGRRRGGRTHRLPVGSG